MNKDGYPGLGTSFEQGTYECIAYGEPFWTKLAASHESWNLPSFFEELKEIFSPRIEKGKKVNAPGIFAVDFSVEFELCLKGSPGLLAAPVEAEVCHVDDADIHSSMVHVSNEQIPVFINDSGKQFGHDVIRFSILFLFGPFSRSFFIKGGRDKIPSP
jgi:hypothetical protein